MATIGNVGEDVNGLGGLALLYYPLAVLYQPSHNTLWFSKEIENVLQARELGDTYKATDCSHSWWVEISFSYIIQAHITTGASAG
ncbi:uncharacterized protein UV8b_05979 [Ustilaginoidea virens]|uniref:Uncharacterized protein n=1 Tax=Ustilaginoidea virens TaxID=1159556 RepID=A0A8E5MJ73_USTVR|nr:uncharacterized protein UV8b_05979 [Ustilaginoidea virens]QUC21736.1 hypothetical protein UV8b_05979 [Ustilaginoidea virens]